MIRINLFIKDNLNYIPPNVITLCILEFCGKYPTKVKYIFILTKIYSKNTDLQTVIQNNGTITPKRIIVNSLFFIFFCQTIFQIQIKVLFLPNF